MAMPTHPRNAPPDDRYRWTALSNTTLGMFMASLDSSIAIISLPAIAGQFIGLVVGGILADVDWRLVFWVNVPFGLFGTVWAYRKLRELGHRVDARLDWLGNLTFAAGLVAVLVGITYGIQPY